MEPQTPGTRDNLPSQSPDGTANQMGTTNPQQPSSQIAARPPLVTYQADNRKPAGTGKLKSILSTIAILLIAPLIALFITAFVFQSYEVDGQSMQNTLQNNDRLIIWKVARTWSKLTNHDYTPNRGDIIVFVKKGLYELNGSSEKQLIKRVIALPGERVTVKDGVVTVYNKAHPEGFIPDKTLPYGAGIPSISDGNVDIVVPAGEIFVCGDNRANSLDSRSFGPVPVTDIVGKLAVRILPISSAEKF